MNQSAIAIDPPDPFQYVIAILLVNGRYVLQLRDDKPGIRHPGVWAFFGGAVEPGESFLAAVHREIQEELELPLTAVRCLGTFEYLDDFTGKPAQVAAFEADLTAQWGLHRLMEGQAAAHFAYEELTALPMPAMVRSILARHYAKEPLLSCTD